MPFQLSPGVLVVEKDLTNIIPAVAASTGGYAGAFNWGPVMDPVLVSAENELVAKFGKPNAATAASFFSAANFLAYTNSLYNVRVTANDAANAMAAQSGSLLSANVAAAGTGFTDIPTVSITGGTGSGGTAVAKLKVVSAVIFGAGTGWAPNDTFTVNIGSGTEATFKVDTVGGGGAVTGISIVSNGVYTDIVASLSAVPTVETTGNTGVNLTIDISLGLESVTVSGGSYTVAPSLSANGSQGGSGSTIDTVTLLTTSSNFSIDNQTDYENTYAGGNSNAYGLFAAKYPGSLGNSIKVAMCDATGSQGTFDAWNYADQFDGRPGTSSYASQNSGSDDEMHVIVIDNDGKITGVPGTVLEKFAFVSKASDAVQENGTSNYYKNVINNTSKWIWWMDHQANDWGGSASTVFTVMSSPFDITLAGGANGGTPTLGNHTAGWDLFSNAEALDVSLLVAGPASPALSKYVIQIAEARKDAVAFVSPADSNGDVIVGADFSAVLADTIAFRTDPTFNVNSSYGVLDSGWKYQYDRYNDVYRWVPLNGDVAGLCARTDSTNDPWWSPGGLNRGQIKNVVKLSFSPSQAARDQLYKNGINPVVSFPGQGTVLFGDKTLLSRPSAFDRINVRRLFIVLEKAIATASKYQLFEFNDGFTRAQFKSMVEPFLRDVQGRRGITDFRCICDETNNTGEVIDRNEFIADIYIKPTRAINFITLNFIATRTGISFDEIAGA